MKTQLNFLALVYLFGGFLIMVCNPLEIEIQFILFGLSVVFYKAAKYEEL